MGAPLFILTLLAVTPAKAATWIEDYRAACGSIQSAYLAEDREAHEIDPRGHNDHSARLQQIFDNTREPLGGRAELEKDIIPKQENVDNVQARINKGLPSRIDELDGLGVMREYQLGVCRLKVAIQRLASRSASSSTARPSSSNTQAPASASNSQGSNGGQTSRPMSIVQMCASEIQAIGKLKAEGRLTFQPLSNAQLEAPITNDVETLRNAVESAKAFMAQPDSSDPTHTRSWAAI